MQQQFTQLPIEYIPSRGISTFNVPHMHASSIVELKKRIDAFLTAVKNFRIRHVILNFSHTDVSVGDDTFRLMLNYLIIGLKYTEASHIARVAFATTAWEHKATAAFSNASIILQHKVQLGNFTNLHDAQYWLQPKPVMAS